MIDMAIGSGVIDPGRFRQVLGQYPTGVCAVTATEPDGTPVGLVVGSFSSVSLDPPLVAFMPAKSSSTWPKVRATGRFCVNVLAHDQEDVCRALASKGPDKFAGLDWRAAASGSPVLDGAVAWIDCELEAVHAAGDHDIVIGVVRDLEVASPSLPLLFFRGGYGRFTPLSMATVAGDLTEQLRFLDLARAEMEWLAAELGVECVASALADEDIVIMASAGKPANAQVPTLVGLRFPLVPPLGALFVAWDDDARVDAWLKAGARSDGADAHRQQVERVRQRGYSLVTNDAAHAEMDQALTKMATGRFDRRATADLRGVVDSARDEFDAVDVPAALARGVRSISAPVFGPNGRVALVVSTYVAPAGWCDGTEHERRVRLLLAATSRITEAAGGRVPEHVAIGD